MSVINYNDAKEASFAYNKVGELVSITDWNGTTTFELDLLGQLKKVTDHKGKTVAYAYDEVGNQTSVKYPDGGVVENTYDAEGNLTYEYKRDSDGEDSLFTHTTHSYDALNRLTGSITSYPAYPNIRNTYTYTYDTLGNLVREVGPTNQDVDTYQYNTLNQMVGKEECGYVQSITQIHSYGYAYDGRGNLTSEWEICAPTTEGPKNITVGAYVYDETNRMVQGTNEKGEVSRYTYNGLGVRVGTEYIVADNSHGYTDFHCETPSVETGITTPEVVKTDYVIDYTRINVDQRVLWKSEVGGYDYRYVYGLDALSVKVTGEGTDWWGQQVKQNIYKGYYHQDKLGSIVTMTDGFGRVSVRTDYDDWGTITATDSITVDGGFRLLSLTDNYTGHEFDDVLGLYYAKYRMYDSTDRRFISADMLKGTVYTTQTINPYLYVMDNPQGWIDPLGLISSSIYNSSDIPAPVRKLDGKDWSSAPSVVGEDGRTYYSAAYVYDVLHNRENWTNLDPNRYYNPDTKISTLPYTYNGVKVVLQYNTSNSVPRKGIFKRPINGSTFTASLIAYETSSSFDRYIPGSDTAIKLIYSDKRAYINLQDLYDYFILYFCDQQGSEVVTPSKPITPDPLPEKPANRYDFTNIKMLIKDYEDFSAVMYDANPPTGDWTIGYGHKVFESEMSKYQNMQLSQAEADQLFEKDFEATIGATLMPLVEQKKLNLSQQQLDAMILFAFQYGRYSFSNDDEVAYQTMRDFLVKGDYSESAVRKAYSTYMGPSALPGTIARNNDGIELFLYGDYTRDFNYSKP